MQGDMVFWFALDCLFQGVFAQRYSPVIVGCYHYAWHTHQSMEGYSPLDKLSEDEMAFLYTSKSTFNALDASLRNQRTVEECLGEAQASWYRVAILRCMQLLHTGNCLFGFGMFPFFMSHFGFILFSFQPLCQASLPFAMCTMW